MKQWAKIIIMGSIIIGTTGCANKPPIPTNFDECVDAGGAIWASYPLECRMPDGTVFVQDLGFEIEPGSPRPEKTPHPEE